MPDSALSETDQAGALLEADPQRQVSRVLAVTLSLHAKLLGTAPERCHTYLQPSAQPHQVSKRAVTPSPSDLESMGSGQMANAC